MDVRRALLVWAGGLVGWLVGYCQLDVKQLEPRSHDCVGMGLGDR